MGGESKKDTRKFTGTISLDSGKGGKLKVKFLEVEDFPWSVTREGENITFKLGEGKDEKEEVHKTTDVREFLIKNFNWNGIVNMMHLLEEKSDRLETYTRPTNLKGTAEDDDILIIPDEAIEAIIYEQAKYAIETKYADDPDGKIDDILKYVDGKPKKGFAEDVLGTTYEDLLKEDDNSSMEYDGKSFKMPNLKTVNEGDLYDFLRSLTLSRNGLWSDESEITNFVSIRRDIETVKSKYNDTLFLAWKDGGTKKALQYLGSTEPGKLKEGQLEAQTATMVLGIHKGLKSKKETPAGRTRNAYRKSQSSSSLYFKSGDTSMNVHYGHPDMVSTPKDYGLSLNKEGKKYPKDSLDAFIIIVNSLKILAKWGAGKTSKITSYKNLENHTKSFSVSNVIGETDATKKIEITSDNDNKVVKKLLYSKYTTFISSKYGVTNNKTKDTTSKKNLIKLIMNYHNRANDDTQESTYTSKDLKDILKDAKDEKVFKSVIETQLEYELDLSNVDACPGNGTIKKIDLTITEKEEKKKEFEDAKKDANNDWDELKKLFSEWDSNTILSKQNEGSISLKEHFKTKVKFNKEDYKESSLIDVDDKGGVGINKDVSGWSQGCQIILGGEYFYTFLSNVIQFLPNSNQERWYYTLVDSSTITDINLK